MFKVSPILLSFILLVILSCSDIGAKQGSINFDKRPSLTDADQTNLLREIKNSLIRSDRNRFDLYSKSKQLLMHAGFKGNSLRTADANTEGWWVVYSPNAELTLKLPDKKNPYRVHPSKLRIYPGSALGSVCFAFLPNDAKHWITLRVTMDSCFDQSLTLNVYDPNTQRFHGGGDLLGAFKKNPQPNPVNVLTPKHMLFKLGCF